MPKPTDEEERVLKEICDSMQKLRALGWSGSPFPRGRSILVVEAGSTGVFRGRYEGSSFWIEEDGDMWPSTPIAWKEDTDADADA